MSEARVAMAERANCPVTFTLGVGGTTRQVSYHYSGYLPRSGSSSGLSREATSVASRSSSAAKPKVPDNNATTQQLLHVLSVMDVTRRYLRHRVKESTRTIVQALATDSPGKVLQAMKVRDVALAMLEKGEARRRALLRARLGSVDSDGSDENEDIAEVPDTFTEVFDTHSPTHKLLHG